MGCRASLEPVEIDDPMLFEAMVQSVIDARAMEMATTGGFGIERDADRGGVEPIVSSAFCGCFGRGPAERFADVFDQAAFLADHIANGHVFTDGNKRTAVRMALSLLAMRGIAPDIDDPPDRQRNELYLWVQALVVGKLSADNISFLLRWKSGY